MSDAKPTLLLVDDEEDIVLVVSKRLENAGFEVAVARDGEEALQMAKALPDLIILDVMLPKRSGLHVCAMLRKEQPYDHIPIILHTAKGDEDTMTSFRSDETLLKEWGLEAPKGSCMCLLQRLQRPMVRI